MTTKHSGISAIKIKNEPASNDLKELTETAMNELLCWYGYNGNKMKQKLLEQNQAKHDNHLESINEEKTFRKDCSGSEFESSREHSISPTENSNRPRKSEEDNCGWCHRVVLQNSPQFLATSDGPRYCSESCFTQSRRASFKRAKTCDWCRHVRHAVNYVDLQDGISQLQFCSDKCLNQYKMQIFCKETQAHLDMHPHLRDDQSENSSSLITPELWLKNCRSRAASPQTNSSRTPSPSMIQNCSNIINKPIIKVAPVSKLMSKNSNLCQDSHKINRRKKIPRQNLILSKKTGNFSTEIQTLSRNSHNKSKILVNHRTNTVDGQNIEIQDLSRSYVSSTQSPNQVSKYLNFSFNELDNNNYKLNISPEEHLKNQPHQTQTYTQPSYPFFSEQTPRIPHIPHLYGTTPPITVMIPYPVIIPVPIPIPIPLPISHFIDAYREEENSSTETASTENLFKCCEENFNTQQYENNTEGPLDFTKFGQTSNRRLSKSSDEYLITPNILEVEIKESSPKKLFTRLTKKSAFKEAENTKSLRKRKRIIDCEFNKSTKENIDHIKTQVSQS